MAFPVRYDVGIHHYHSTAQHSAAQHSAVNPHKQLSKYAPITARPRKQADRVGSSQTERRKRNLPCLQQNKTMLKQLSWCDFACILLFLSVLSISSMHAASGLFRGPWSSWHWQVASLHQFALKTMESFSWPYTYCLKKKTIELIHTTRTYKTCTKVAQEYYSGVLLLSLIHI